MPSPVPQHTVAVSIPGTTTRVLVDKLEGTEQEAISAAHLLVQEFAFVPPVQWAHKVVATNLVTEVTVPESQQEKPE